MSHATYGVRAGSLPCYGRYVSNGESKEVSAEEESGDWGF